MKISIITIIAAAVLAQALPGTAQAESTSKRAAPTSATPDLKAFDARLAEAQTQMQRMQEQMDRLRKITDPSERQALLNQHWVAMQNAMNSMHGMWRPDMMGCCGAGGGMMHGSGMMGGRGPMGWGAMRDHYSRLTPDQLKQRQYMMDQYIGMQQMMMEHMMMRQEWMAPAPPPAGK